MLMLTGASGYLGRALASGLRRQGAHAVALVRGSGVPGLAQRHLDLAHPDSFEAALSGCDTLVHMAGVAHRSASDDDYATLNVAASAALARAAKQAGVRRFLFLSSLNVVPADADRGDSPAAAYPEPAAAYARSKWLAEQQLTQTLAASGCRLLIVRPALVYDRELVANLQRIRRLAATGRVLLPDVGQRAMVARPDLTALLLLMLGAEGKGAGEGADWPVPGPVVATDGECYSARRISVALSRNGRATTAVPVVFWKMAAAARDVARRKRPGATWLQLAEFGWCGAPSAVAGWQPEFTLEALQAAAF